MTSDRLETCEGFDALRARGATRWSVLRSSKVLGRCEYPGCSEPLAGVYRSECIGANVRFVCVSHPIGVVVPRIGDLPAPRPGSFGELRLREALERGGAS